MLVVLSISVGIVAIGVIVGSQMILKRELPISYMKVNPAHATLHTSPFDSELVRVVRKMSEVREAEGRHHVTVRLQIGAGQWQELKLFAISNVDDIQINKVRPVSGVWPPPEGELLIERASLSLTNRVLGDMALIETSNGKQRQLRIAGLVHDLNQFPAQFIGIAYGYISFDTLEWLGQSRTFNRLHLTVAENEYDKEHVQDVANDVRDKLEKAGYDIFSVQVHDPGKHPFEKFLTPMSLLLGTMGTLSLLLSGFLVWNTISALLTQHIRQIGVMKAIGAQTNQIAGIYLLMVLILALLALMIAVPLSVLGTDANTSLMASLMNIDITNFDLPPQVFALEVVIGLMTPLLAALYPIYVGTRITVHEAISDYGLTPPSTNRINRLLEQVHNLPRPLLLSLRNTFRRTERLALTLISLTLASAIFMGIFSVRASLLLTLNEAFAYWNYEVDVSFSRSYRIVRIESEAMRVPGVIKAEGWDSRTARRVRPDGNDGEGIITFALPAETELLNPSILQGRWLLPEDANALVINTEVLREEPDIKINDDIVIKIDGRETDWHVVGIIRGVVAGPFAYTNYPYFERLMLSVGRANSLQVVLADGTSQSQVAKGLEEHFNQIGWRVSSISTLTEKNDRATLNFNVIVVLLATMAILLAVVGGLGLMATMSLNVLERQREIGIMRAIGASNSAVQQIVIVEGILIGLLSWLIGIPPALLISKLLSNAVGRAFIKTPLSYTFSIFGVLLWMVVVVIIAALASSLPARRASQITVREALAYE
jgi:putative ABC transport system permease protein